MSEADDLIVRLYPNSPDEEERLEGIWKTFNLAHPRMHFLHSKRVRKAVEGRDRSFFTKPLRLCFFPDLEDEADIQERFRQASNKGIDAVNSLVRTNLTDVCYDFTLDEVSSPLDLLEFMRMAREEWIDARNGKHIPDPHLMLFAYNKCRVYSLGHRILMIDEEPKVVNSIRHHDLVLRWFYDFLNFSDPREEQLEGFSRSWNTKVGRVYGNNEPIRHRVKALDREGNIRYDSLLMKMSLKQSFFDEIDDYTGVEFVVEDENTRKELIRLFSYDSTPNVLLEDFKDRSQKKTADNPHSSPDFGVMKFRVRPPVLVNYPGFGKSYERIPVEIQILTLEDDKIRKENSEVGHDSYKRRQFIKVFPAWFPRQIYEPLIRELYAKVT